MSTLEAAALRPPPAVRWICRTLEDAGYETWAVGGAVRDALAGRPSQDWDLTTRAHPNQVRRLFRRTVPIGIEHGTVGILARDGTLFEVTTFRRDVETTGRHAVVAFADRLDDDLARRDFTINAVAWHPIRGEIHDPFGGAGDMTRRVLKTVGDPRERFAEDYLRILRALRFAGRFSLRVDTETWTALCSAVPDMGRLSPERVREELDKVLATPTSAQGRPSAGLTLYAASGVLAFLLPELDSPLARSRWGVTMGMVDALPPRALELRLAALLSGAGSTRGAVALLTRLRSSNRRIGEVGALAGALANLPPSEPGVRHPFLAEPLARRRWMVRLGRPLVLPMLRLVAARARIRSLAEEPSRATLLRDDVAHLIRAIRQDLADGVPLDPSELALSGRDLIRAGHRPGPAFGRVLETLLQDVLQDPSRNQLLPLLERAEALLAADDHD